MGKFADRLGFGKPQYAAPQIAPVPERLETDQTGTFINEAKREIIVRILDNGKPEDLATALGALEIAKDVIKHTLTAWHERDRRVKGIIVPQKGNGHV